MTREEQLVFCKKCLNRKMDFQQGILCSLTGEKAQFENTCPDFKRDDSVTEEPIEGQDRPISPIEKIRTLPMEQLEKLRMEQNLGLGLGMGAVSGLLGAILWGLITVITNYQIGYMAIAIGAGVGFSIRYFGKGIDMIFGISGAVIAVASCFIGNFLSIIGFIANAEGISYMNTLIEFDYSYFVPLMQDTFQFMDVLFYGIAGYEGFKFSFRQLD